MGLFDKQGNSNSIRIGDKEYKSNPEATLFSTMGLTQYENRDYRSAIASFTKAINAMPANQHFYKYRGTAYEDMGNDLEAEKDFRKALEVDPSDFVAAFRLGFVFFRKKDLLTAIKWLKVAHEKFPVGVVNNIGLGDNNIVYVSKKIITYNLGNFLIQVNQVNEGLKYIDEAIKLDPNYANPYLVKGITLSQLNRVDEGIASLKVAEKLGLSQATAVINMLKKPANEVDLNFEYVSADHIRYENGVQVSGPHGGARRLVKVESNINGGEGYSVSIYNLDGQHPVWRDNLQMAHKQMKIVALEENKIALRGYGSDIMGNPFSDYGLTIIVEDGNILRCFLHMIDRNVDIEYLP